MMSRPFSAVLLLCVLPSLATAATTAASLFVDHAVLQSGMPVPVWGTDDPGRSVAIQFAGQTVSATADRAGHWMAKFSSLAPSNDGREMTITGSSTIKISDVLVGEVWVCSGQSNMEFGFGGASTFAEDRKTANDTAIRQLTVLAPPADEPQTTLGDVHWVPGTMDAASKFTAIGYYFARKLKETLNEPIGLIQTPAGGTRLAAWEPRDVLESNAVGKADVEKYLKQSASYTPESAAAEYQQMLKDWQKRLDAYDALPADKQIPSAKPLKPREPVEPKKNNQHPFGLYDARIRPLMPYAIRGVLWYQGEANAGIYSAFDYRNQFPPMIAAWQRDWGQGPFPFLYVQLPRFDFPPLTDGWALFRESQLKSLIAPDSGMAVTIDVPDINNLHPRNKKPVGERLVPLALKLAYGRDIVANGPMYDHATFDDGKAQLYFTSIGSGLDLRPSPTTSPSPTASRDSFEIAGSDHHFVPADATIDGDHVVVSSSEVAQPAAVRYAWAAAPNATLFNKEGFPASPFRTDDWPVPGQPANAATEPAKVMAKVDAK